MKFGLCGMGYISRKHLQAIKEVGGELIAFLNPSDSVGFVDQYFPNAEFFKNETDFFEYIKGVDYVSICSPNFRHFYQIQWAKSIGAKVICEKPIVLNETELEDLKVIDGEVNAILQLRLHPEIKKLKIKGDHAVTINYTTPRGRWYDRSWKSDYKKSGGFLMNIGVHMFDLMFHLFGDFDGTVAFNLGKRSSTGMLQFEKASVTYNLALEGELKRELIIDDKKIDLTNIDLHTESYKEIIAGRGFKDFDDSIGLINDLYTLHKHIRKDG
jgi:UDP-N-acetyl-2-amino-2-deoxyglucuronate dehydrogenase